METVIVLSVLGVLFVGCWHVGNVSQEYRKQLEADPESVDLIERKSDWAIWGPFLVAIAVTAWVTPISIGYVVAAYLLYWAVDGVWFKFVDWCVAGANGKNPARHIRNQSQLAAKGPARLRHMLLRTGRADGAFQTRGG